MVKEDSGSLYVLYEVPILTVLRCGTFFKRPWG